MVNFILGNSATSFMELIFHEMDMESDGVISRSELVQSLIEFQDCPQ